jgi:hypothetical protein
MSKFPGTIPRRFDMREDYCEYFRNLIMFEKFTEIKECSERVFKCAAFKCFGGDVTNKRDPGK